MRLISLSHTNHIERVETGFRTMVFPRGTQETGIVAEAMGGIEADELSVFFEELMRHVSRGGKVNIEIKIDDTTEASHNVHGVIGKYHRKQNGL